MAEIARGEAEASLRWVPVEGPLPAVGCVRATEIDGRALLVCNVGGTAYAIEDRCPHSQFALREGRLTGSVLECPLHGGKLDVRDGSPVALPIRRPVPTFPVRQSGARIEIGLPAPHAPDRARR